MPPDWPKPIPEEESYTLTLTAPATTYPCLSTNTVKAEVFNTVDSSPGSALLNQGIRLTGVLYDTGEYKTVYMRKTGETDWSDRLLYPIVLLADGINYGFEEDIEVWLDGRHDSLTVTFTGVIYTLEAGPTGSDTSGSLIGAPCNPCPGDCSLCCDSLMFVFGQVFDSPGPYRDFNCETTDTPHIARYIIQESSCAWPFLKWCLIAPATWGLSAGRQVFLKCYGNFWYLYSALDFDDPQDDDIIARLAQTTDCPELGESWDFYNHKALAERLNTGTLTCIDCVPTDCEVWAPIMVATISGLTGSEKCGTVELCSKANGAHELAFDDGVYPCNWELGIGDGQYRVYLRCVDGVWWLWGWAGSISNEPCWAFRYEGPTTGSPPTSGWVPYSGYMLGYPLPTHCPTSNPSASVDPLSP